MNTIASLNQHRESRIPLRHNSETWRIVSVEECAGHCGQRLSGRDCAGVVTLIDTEDHNHWNPPYWRHPNSNGTTNRPHGAVPAEGAEQEATA